VAWALRYIRCRKKKSLVKPPAISSLAVEETGRVGHVAHYAFEDALAALSPTRNRSAANATTTGKRRLPQ